MTTIFILILSSTLLACSLAQIDDQFLYCLQDRHTSQMQDKCADIMLDFCSMIQCQPIENCDEDDNKAIVNNVTGGGCCPGCVQLLNIGESCDSQSKLRRCQGGHYCNPNTKQCASPDQKTRCVREADNKRLAQNNGMLLYVNGSSKGAPVYFDIPFANDMDMVSCDAKSGHYELKQCRGGKCFCVDAESGQYTFGMTLKDSTTESADNVTCLCSQYFHDKLVTGRVDKDYMEFYAEVHQKCDSSGNFAPLQCINQTCFCVDVKTGKPDFGHVAMYGALSTLPCFDTEKAKTLQSNNADLNYQNECERQMSLTQKLSLHFVNKGTKLRNMDKLSCSYDGRFSAKQCKPELCNCVTPDTCENTLYKLDRSSGKDADMNCMCGREVYYASVQKKGYSRLQCESSGNFKSFQSSDDGKEAFCVDDNGARISMIINNVCLHEFVKTYDLRLSPEVICQQMRVLLTDQVLEADKYYIYGLSPNGEENVLTESTKPTNLFCNHTSNTMCNKCNT